MVKGEREFRSWAKQNYYLAERILKEIFEERKRETDEILRFKGYL